jgi:hypothetical protein
MARLPDLDGTAGSAAALARFRRPQARPDPAARAAQGPDAPSRLSAAT